MARRKIQQCAIVNFDGTLWVFGPMLELMRFWTKRVCNAGVPEFSTSALGLDGAAGGHRPSIGGDPLHLAQATGCVFEARCSRRMNVLLSSTLCSSGGDGIRH
eukprot:2833909-Amphidinium_carterae.3